MKKANLLEAINASERFYEHALDLKKQVELLSKEDPATQAFQHIDIRLSKHTAQVRRSSMDLTRALAALRQGK